MDNISAVPSPLLVPSTPIPPEQIRSEFDLPFSKKHVIVLRGTGRDKRLALLSAGSGADQYRIIDAIAARLCLVDGKKLRMEDFEELDFDDSLMISQEMAKVMNPLAKAMSEAVETGTLTASPQDTPEKPAPASETES